MSSAQTFESELKLLLKTGKVVFGSRKSLKLLKLGKLKMVIITSTLRGDLKEDLKTYAKTNNILLYEYSGSGWDLGKLCGKPFMISTIGVLEFGESKLNQIIEQQKG
jgi:large subunit ribosomal protein L30e